MDKEEFSFIRRQLGKTQSQMAEALLGYKKMPHENQENLSCVGIPQWTTLLVY